MLLVLLAGVLFLASGCAGVSKTVPGESAEAVPPVIDRQLLFGDPEISGSNLSPDGKHVVFIKPYKGVRNVWVKGIHEPFDAARPITADERPVSVYFWSRDSRFILYVQDKGGNENYHVYAVDPKAEVEKATGVPPSRDLTPIDGVRAYIYAVPKKKPGEIIIGLNDRDASYHDVYRVDIATGKRELLIKNTERVAVYFYDLEGNVRLAARQDDEGGWETLRIDGAKLVRIYGCTYEETCLPVRFHQDGKRCYFITNKGSEVDLIGLTLLDPQTGKTTLVESDPEKQVDFSGALFSESTDELIATIYIGDRQRIYPQTDELRKDLDFLRSKLPQGELSLQSMTTKMDKFLVSVSRDVDPGSVYLYDREKKTVELLYRSRPKLPTEHLAAMQPVRYKARDGLEIPAYLTLPRGVEPSKLPTVIFPHGGPWSRDYWGYDPYAQFLANRGYAVLQPNFRASTGYGKKFLNAGNKQWGTGAMQHDLTDGVKWMVDQGFADPQKICIFGGSYGGYATLAGVAFTPDLYTCGVPYVAPSSLITLLESIPSYWKPFSKGFFKRVGDPEVEADRKDMEARSPIFFVDRIKVPLLVVHGANDPRVKQDEADSIVVALRDKGHAVEYLVAPDEGHGFRAPGNRMALAVSMEKFLAKHLGGRYQKEVRPAIADNLAKITVDPASVNMPDKQEKAFLARAETAPLPKANGSLIQPASMKYKLQMSMGQRKIELGATQVVERIEKKDKQRLRVTSTVKMPQGEQVDVIELDGRTLTPISRHVQGMAMATIKLNYKEDAVTGEMNAGGSKMPIDKKLKAPVLGDGAGLELLIAGLPIEAGYATTVRIFEALTQKVRPMKLEVTGKETIQVAAGKFETWILQLKPLDGDPGGGGTLNVQRKAPHHVVRSEYKLPAMMGGGTITSELEATSKSGGS
jgi:dipeptidyl aminopeptidase/acylaminoacyl peptidase